MLNKDYKSKKHKHWNNNIPNFYEPNNIHDEFFGTKNMPNLEYSGFIYHGVIM
jgi:hypothetical protein